MRRLVLVGAIRRFQFRDVALGEPSPLGEFRLREPAGFTEALECKGNLHAYMIFQME